MLERSRDLNIEINMFELDFTTYRQILTHILGEVAIFFIVLWALDVMSVKEMNMHGCIALNVELTLTSKSNEPT